MQLGRRIWTLWRLRPYVLVCAVVALAAAFWSTTTISLSPPALTPRALTMATGTTHVVVDTPTSSVLDLRRDTSSFEAMTQRAILLGNVMANGEVRDAIARRTKIPVHVLQITPPYTGKQPRAQAGSASEKQAADIFESTDQYRLSIQVNPTVPMLDVYSQAPTAERAESLANAAVDALQEYLTQLATTQRIPAEEQIRLLQLGRARGVVINDGVDWQVAFVAFLLTFSFACATTIAVSRVIRGFRVAALADESTTT